MSSSLAYLPEPQRWQAGDGSVFFPKHPNKEKTFCQFVQNRFFPYFRPKSFTAIFTCIQVITFSLQIAIDGLDYRRIDSLFLPPRPNGPLAKALLLQWAGVPEVIKLLNIFGRAIMSRDGFSLALQTVTFACIGSTLEATVLPPLIAPCLCLFAMSVGSVVEAMLQRGDRLSIGSTPALYSIVGYAFGYLCLNHKALRGSQIQDKFNILRLLGLLLVGLLLPWALPGGRDGMLVAGAALSAGTCGGLIFGAMYENLLVEDDLHRKCCKGAGVGLLLAELGLALLFQRLQITF